MAPSLHRVAEILGKYSDLPTSVAEATLVVMAGQMPSSVIWSTDHDFLLYRLEGRRAPQMILPR